MDKLQIQDEIVSCLWSKDLKEHIQEKKYFFSEKQLLLIAYQFAPTYENRLQLLSLLRESFQSISEHAAKCILWQEKKLRLFRDDDPNAVYELRIKTEPDASEERYLCASFEAALDVIDGFYKHYNEEETESVRYWISKRRIIQDGEPFCEDELGECVLGRGKTILSVDFYTEEKENGTCDCRCLDCKDMSVECEEVCFPTFIPNHSAVRYLMSDGSVHFGFSFGIDDLCDRVYIIPLDGEMLEGRAYDAHWGYHWHEHIQSPYVESVDPDTLPDRLKENFYAFLKYAKSQNDLIKR